MELNELEGVGPKTEKALNNQGINNVDDLASSSIENISSAGVSESRAKDLKLRAKENTVIIQSTAEVENEYNSKKHIDTGISELNEIIEGGWEEESIVSVYGDSRTGKTQMCMQALVQGVRETNEDAIYIETERDRYRPKRVKRLNEAFNEDEDYDEYDYEDLKSKIHRVKAYDLDAQLSSYGTVINSFDTVSIVIIDSLTGRMRVSDKFQDRSDYGDRTNLINKHLNRIEDIVENLKCPVLFTNQVYENPDSSNPYQPTEVTQWGGLNIQYFMQFGIHMEEGAGESFVANVDGHPSGGDAEITISIGDKIDSITD